MRIYRAITEEIRVDTSFEERWEGVDKGVITSWEVGRQRRESGDKKWIDLMGGAEEFPRTGLKRSTPNYEAQLQGFRNQDLDVEV